MTESLDNDRGKTCHFLKNLVTGQNLSTKAISDKAFQPERDCSLEMIIKIFSIIHMNCISNGLTLVNMH